MTMFTDPMLRKPAMVGFAAAALVMAGSTAAEAAMCGSRDSVTKLLSSRYKEAPIAIGMVADRGVMEIYVANETATWSIVVTNPQGKTCIIAAGQNYEGVQALLEGPEA